MTTGKSTLAEAIQNHTERLYTVDYDVIKKQISGFYSKRDRTIATQLTYDTLKAVAQTDLPIVALLPPPRDAPTYQQIESFDRDIVNIELIAPLDILVERYKHRLSTLTKLENDPRKLRTLEEFVTTVQTPYFRPANAHTFDTSLQTTDEIFEAIRPLL